MTEVPKKSLKEQLAEYLAKLDSEDFADMPEEDILAMRKFLNPYGRVMEGGTTNKFINMSCTNISREYWTKFYTTAMIGYLNRLCDEWRTPSNIQPVSVYDYLENPDLIKCPAEYIKRNDQRTISDYEFNAEFMKKRIVVKEFLEFVFQFNPDEHLRSAYKPNLKDKSRPIIETMAGKIGMRSRMEEDEKLKEQYETYKTVKKVIKSKDGKTREIETKVLKEGSDPTPFWQFIPPADMFASFRNYYQINYEGLREATNALYAEKPDLELAIIPYSIHDTQEDADLFKKQHAEEVLTEVFTVQTNKWNFFDCFKAQRESVRFYGKDSAAVEAMLDQNSEDAKIGKHLLDHRKTKQKLENTIRDGADSDNFKKWADTSASMSKYGMKYESAELMAKAKKDRIEANKRQQELGLGDLEDMDGDIPDDCLEVPVWQVHPTTGELLRQRFVTTAQESCAATI